MYRSRRSISLPIVLASTTGAVTIALLVGWILLLVQKEVAERTWLLVLGTIALSLIMAVLVIFGVFLVREILEGRRQSGFIDSVTHELKSPLASLKLCAETLARSDLSDSQREELRRMMQGDVERLSVFIDHVLEASRAAHGAVAHSVAEVELKPLLRRCAEAIEARHRLPEGTIERIVPADLRLQTDSTSLEIVVKNLLDNAVKYSDPPARVQLEAKREGETVLIEVRDQGIGIPRRHLGRIFERFYRVPDEAVRARRGTGLGLFVAAALVRTLGGRLEARSGGPARGTAVRVSVPIA